MQNLFLLQLLPVDFSGQTTLLLCAYTPVLYIDIKCRKRMLLPRVLYLPRKLSSCLVFFWLLFILLPKQLCLFNSEVSPCIVTFSLFTICFFVHVCNSILQLVLCVALGLMNVWQGKHPGYRDLVDPLKLVVLESQKQRDACRKRGVFCSCSVLFCNTNDGKNSSNKNVLP